jgi:hypothetical protein
METLGQISAEIDTDKDGKRANMAYNAVLEVTLAPDEEEPTHHHRWRSIFVLDQVQGPIHDIAPDGTQLPPNRDIIKALQAWDGRGCLVVDMAPQPAGRVLNASGKPIHGVRVEMKASK